ncbi:MAG: hypothetical protein AAB400_03920, partial [Patescibacteria group bacterium]
MSEVFRFKSKEELQQQRVEVSRAFGEEIMPHSADDLFEHSEKTLRERYPARFEAYAKMFVSLKSKHFKLSFIDTIKLRSRISILNALETYIERHTETKTKDKTLYDYQFNVFEDLRAFL